MVICGNVLEPHNRERVRENPVYSSEHRQYVHGMMFMRTNVIPEIWPGNKSDVGLNNILTFTFIYFLAAIKLHLYPKQRRSYRVKVGGSKMFFASLSHLSPEL